jgi:hypothetical protein
MSPDLNAKALRDSILPTLEVLRDTNEGTQVENLCYEVEQALANALQTGQPAGKLVAEIEPHIAEIECHDWRGPIKEDCARMRAAMQQAANGSLVHKSPLPDGTIAARVAIDKLERMAGDLAADLFPSPEKSRLKEAHHRITELKKQIPAPPTLDGLLDQVKAMQREAETLTALDRAKTSAFFDRSAKTGTVKRHSAADGLC